MQQIKSFQLTMPPSLSNPDSEKRIESRGSIVIVGANGSGKTRLGSWLEFQSIDKDKVHRIAAQKSLTMPTSVSPMSVDIAEAGLWYGREVTDSGPFDISSFKQVRRWGQNPNTFLLNDFQRLVTYLFSDDYEKSIKYRKDAKESRERIEPPETKLDALQRIWEEVLINRKLHIGGGQIRAESRHHSTSEYPATEMSDGERVVFYLIGQALSAPRDGIIVIDEPELHIHKSIQATLWDKIEAERRDCLFVYLTHDLDFAASRVTASKICLRNYDGESWDWYRVPETGEIPEEVLLEILGSRKPIIFVEGDRSSLDYFVFQNLYSDFTIIPCGSCEHVIHATRSFSSLKNLHRLSSYGIVDRDFRESDEINYLQNINVFVLDFSELENLFLTEKVLGHVASELHRSDFKELFEQVKAIVFREMENGKETLISSITASKVERRLKNFDAKALGESRLVKALDDLITNVDVASLYNSTSAYIEEIIRDRNYSEALKIYNNKGLIYQIGSIFGFKSRELIEYVQRLLSSKEGGTLKLIMKEQIPDVTNSTLANSTT